MNKQNKAQEINVELSDGYTLKAVENTDNGYKEIFIGIVDKDGVWVQDLAIVGEQYDYEEGTLEVINRNGEYGVKVYADSDNEDFTCEFIINRYDELEE